MAKPSLQALLGKSFAVRMRKLFVRDTELFDQIIEVGKKHEVINLGVRILETNTASKIEAAACKVQWRIADPLTG